MCKAHFISCFANSCNLIKFLKQYLNIFVRNFVLCIQIRFVSTAKKIRASPRVHLVHTITPPSEYGIIHYLYCMGSTSIYSYTYD